MIAFVILLGLWSRMDEKFIEQLANPEVARGMIGFLFAMGTIGIALLSVVAVFASSDPSKSLEDRFTHGKDILTILIGVLGTIVGFYFGQAVFEDDQPDQTTVLSTTSQETEREQAGGPVEPDRPAQ